ncbi:MAG: hypothetical protein AAF658_15840, partial [Myxococcota bacterium]
MRTTTTLLVLVSAIGVGCGSDEGEVIVSAYGEDFIELGLTSEDLEDDWSVNFSRFDVSVDAVDIADLSLQSLGSVALARESGGEGHEIARGMAAVGDYDGPRYVMSDIRVTGQAVLGNMTKAFDWSFPASVTYENCETRTSVSADGAARFEITVHSDHLFYDSLVAEEPLLFFGPIAAADTNDDGDITQSELAGTDSGA